MLQGGVLSEGGKGGGQGLLVKQRIRTTVSLAFLLPQRVPLQAFVVNMRPI